MLDGHQAQGRGLRVDFNLPTIDVEPTKFRV